MYLNYFSFKFAFYKKKIIVLYMLNECMLGTFFLSIDAHSIVLSMHRAKPFLGARAHASADSPQGYWY